LRFRHEPCASRHIEPSILGSVSSDPRHTLGRVGERHARAHLERLGYTVVEQNFRTREGELDLIVHGARTLVFCEVKTRRAGPGSPWDALGPRKRRQVRMVAARWLAERLDRPAADDLRFDAIGVVIDATGRLVRLDHLEGAF
jgi:putative endonuclease